MATSLSHGAVAGASPITGWTLLRVLWRSFFFLAAQNYERMQNVGFGYAMLPALTRLYEGDRLREAMNRHLEFFNSHPYMAGALLGASVKLEEEVAAGRLPPERVSSFKRCLMGPLAAIGDNFFWASLRPFGAAWAIAGALSGILWAPLAFLLLYNVFHLTIRAYGVFAGYQHGERVFERVRQLELVRFADRSHYLSGAFLGVGAALFAEEARSASVTLGGGLGALLLLVLTVIALLCLKRKMSMPVVLFSLAGGCVALVLGLDSMFPLVQ